MQALIGVKDMSVTDLTNKKHNASPGCFFMSEDDRPSSRLDGSLPGLDIAKFICAAIVVAIHTKPFAGIPSEMAQRIVIGIQDVAVPFFFIASSFLCFRKVDVEELSVASGRDGVGVRRIRDTIAKMLRLYIAWTVLYLPVTILGFVLNGTGFLRALMVFARGTLFIGENFCSWPLWYLLASVVGYSATYMLLLRGASWRTVLLIGLVASVAGYGMSELRGCGGLLGVVLESYFYVFGTVRNGLFEGFPYITIGMAIAIKRRAFERILPIGAVTLTAAGLAGNILISSDAHLPFCAAFAIGIFALSCAWGEGTHPFLRASSTVTYLTHMMVAVIVVYLVAGGRSPSLLDNGVPNFVLFVAAYLTTIVASIIVWRLRERFVWVKDLFGV